VQPDGFFSGGQKYRHVENGVSDRRVPRDATRNIHFHRSDRNDERFVQATNALFKGWSKFPSWARCRKRQLIPLLNPEVLSRQYHVKLHTQPFVFPRGLSMIKQYLYTCVSRAPLVLHT
jgi:hypothetical protein